MDFSGIIADIKNSGLAARRYEQDGHRKFRDCLTVGVNGRLRFERYCYGEAASLVFAMWGIEGEEGGIKWDYDATDYTDKTEAPQALTGLEGDKLVLDEKRLAWSPATDLKTWPEAGLGRLKMLFKK